MNRGTCPVCNHEVAVRKGGGLVKHHRRRSSGPPAFREPAGAWVKCGGFASGAEECPGTGRPSIEEIERELERRGAS